MTRWQVRQAQKLSDGVVALRHWREADARTVVACIDGDEEIARWLDQVPQPYTLAHALGYIRSDSEEKYAVTEAATGVVLGSIGLTWNPPHDVAEVGYWVRSGARGRGITTRALGIITRHAIASGAARVQLRADVENASSRRGAEKAGFRQEGVLRSSHWNARLGRRQDWVMYSLLAHESSAT